MKYMTLVLFVLLPLICKCQTTRNEKPYKKTIHSTINATGEDLSNREGSITYSIGQVFYSSHNSKENSIVEGVQQPLIISIRPIDNKEKNFKVAAYPNPVSNHFIIEASTYTDRSLSYQLMDLHGKLLKEDRIGKSGARVNIGNLPVAIYLIKISDNGEFIKTIKIIKK